MNTLDAATSLNTFYKFDDRQPEPVPYVCTSDIDKNDQEQMSIVRLMRSL